MWNGNRYIAQIETTVAMENFLKQGLWLRMGTVTAIQEAVAEPVGDMLP